MNLPRSSHLTEVSLRFLSAALLLGLLLLPAGQLSAQQILAEVENLGDTLVFHPVTEFGELILTVTGPCDFRYRQRVTQGEPFFRLDATTIDGTYTYDLVRVDRIDPGIIEILQNARKNLDEETPRQLCRDGKLPGSPVSQSEGFLVSFGEIVYDPFTVEKGAGLRSASGASGSGGPMTVAGGSDSGDLRNVAAADFVIIDDLIVDGSACIGFDCVNGESFGFDTIRVKENNLRIKFDDTSTAASFPRNDWQLTANDSANGGASKFSIDDISGSRTPFTVEANARSHSLYIDDGGRIGSRTSTPSTEIHTVDGDTPTLRLQQDGSSGFAPQTWDVAGNETNFFIRDVTNGSKLPFRIRPDAPTSSIDIASDGDVGFGTASPAGRLHVENTGADDADDFLVTADGQLTIGSTNAGSLPTLMKLTNPAAGTGGGDVRFVLENSSGDQWSFTNDNIGTGELEINFIPNAGTEVLIDGSGNVTATSFNPTSSRTLKDSLLPIDPREILSRLSQLPISTWKFIWEESNTRHLGPMAEEFKAAFGLGQSDKTINLTDAAGVAFAAIQGLQLELAEKNEKISDLEERLAKLEALLAE